MKLRLLALAAALLFAGSALAQTPNIAGPMVPNGSASGTPGSGTVTSVGETFTGGLISVAGSPVTTAGTLALTVAGTSGGIPYFSGASTWASSGALAANALMIGGGAGVAPSTTTTGTGILTALGVNVGSAGAPVLFNGAGGTPSSLTLTNASGLPISSGVSGLGTGVATALAVNTGSAGAPVLFNGAGGTPSSLTLTNATGLPTSTGIANGALPAGVTINNGNWSGTVLSGANGGTGVANTGSTITLGGNLTTSGAFATTLTVGASTNVTLPASGTLAILGANTFTGAQTVGSNAVIFNGSNLIADAANTLALRNGATAQTSRVYNTFTDASNGEWASLDWSTSANTFTIATKANGTGSNRGITLLPANGGVVIQGSGIAVDFINQTPTTFRLGQWSAQSVFTIGIPGTAFWDIPTTGHWLAHTDNTYDIGALAATRPRNVYAGTGYGAAGSAGVSCASGTVVAATVVVVGGIVTHC